MPHSNNATSKRRPLLPLLLANIITCLLIGCTNDVVKPTYSNWKVFTMDNSSLPSNKILEIICDSNYIWILTDKSNVLTRYSSKTGWKNYYVLGTDNPGNSVYGLTLDNSNNIWMIRNVISPAVIKFDSLWTLIDNTNSNIPNCIMQQLTFDNNNTMWLASACGLVKYDGINFTTENRSNSAIPAYELLAIKNDKDNSIWFSTMAHAWATDEISGLVHFKDSVLAVYTSDNSGLPSNAILHMDFEKSAIKWFGTGAGIVSFNGSSWYPLSKLQLNNEIPDKIIVDRNNVKWICTDRNGLIKYDDASIASYTISNSGLPSNYVRSVTVDTKNSVWIGTDKGLAVLDQE